MRWFLSTCLEEACGHREEVTSHIELEVKVESGDTGGPNTNLSMLRFPSSTSAWATLVLSTEFGLEATVGSSAAGAAVGEASSAGFLTSVGTTSVDGAEINALIWKKTQQETANRHWIDF